MNNGTSAGFLFFNFTDGYGPMFGKGRYEYEF